MKRICIMVALAIGSDLGTRLRSALKVQWGWVAETFAPRLDTLAGKTVCELWNGLWGGPTTFPLIRQQLQKEFPTAKIVTYDKMTMVRHTRPAAFSELADVVKAAGCQAVIVGNAG